MAQAEANQHSEIDSLKALLKTTHKEEDKISLYGKVCWRYMGQSQLDLATQYCDSVKLLSKKLNNELGLIRSIYYYGIIARLKGDYTESLELINQYVQYYQRHGDSLRVAGGLYQVGVVNSDLGNYDKSLAAYYRAIAIEQKENNLYSVGFTMNAIGSVLKETKKYADAEKIYTRALHIFDSLDEKSDKTDVLVNLGNLYTETGQFKKARENYNEALRINREIDKKAGVAVTLANIAFLFDKMAQYDSALVYHLKGLAIRETLPGKEELARSMVGAGRGYGKLKQYALAKHYLLKGLALGKEIQIKPVLQDSYENLAEVYANEGDFSNAHRYHKLYSEMKDSVLSEQTARQLNELQTKYETGEKDKQIALLAQEKVIQQKEAQRQAALKEAFSGGLVLVTLLAVLLVYIFRQRLKHQKSMDSKNNEIREVNYKRQLSELEMKALRAQINPHFLFNCMNSINRMILNGETEDSSIYLAKFSKLVRLILENTEAATVSLDNELALLESYIQLEELRFKGKIGYEISVDESIEPESTYLPSMVLQPFVENAIWHGLMHKEQSEKGIISIALKEVDDRLLCTIEDNGVGRERAKQLREKSVLKSKSMGMRITEERLKLLSHGSQKDFVRITDLKDTLGHASGTRIEINIPLS